jgi:hypothetical protein
MRRVTMAMVLASVAAACDTRSTPAPSPSVLPAISPAPAPPPPPVPTQSISIGQTITGFFTGQEHTFDLDVPSSGTLVVRLDWDLWYNGSLLVLRVGDAEFRTYAPITGRMLVTGGKTYRLSITGGGTDWWYDDKYVLTTSME